MIKIPEKKRLGIIIKLPMSRKEKEQVLVIFVDNTDFLSTEEEVIEKMIQLLQTHAELFQDTGRRIQYEKIACFSWK